MIVVFIAPHSRPIAVVLDMLINSICALLTFSFHEKKFEQCCCCFNQCVLHFLIQFSITNVNSKTKAKTYSQEKLSANNCVLNSKTDNINNCNVDLDVHSN